MNKCMERIKNGIITENPTFVQILGMCPTLAVTTSAINGLGMGLSTTVILIMSNLMISALRNIIPNRVRIPAYIVIVASFVTIIDFLLQAFLPGLSESLGGYIKLIVVNCIILGRAESYASKNPVVPSIFDGVGMGLGFTVGLTAIGLVRELLGAGSIFGIAIPGYQPIGIFVLSPGAFIVLAFLIAFLNYRKQKKKQTDTNDTICRSEDCMHCGNTSCGGKFFDFDGDTDVISHAGQKQTAGPTADVQKKQSVNLNQTNTEPSKAEETPKQEMEEQAPKEKKQGKADASKQEETRKKKKAEQTKDQKEQKEEKSSRTEEVSGQKPLETTEAAKQSKEAPKTATVEQTEKASETTAVKQPETASEETAVEHSKKKTSSGKGKKKKSKKKNSNSGKEKAGGMTEAAGTAEESNSSEKKTDRQEVEADE